MASPAAARPNLPAAPAGAGTGAGQACAASQARPPPLGQLARAPWAPAAGAGLRGLQELPEALREAAFQSPLVAGLESCGPMDAAVCLAVAAGAQPRKASSPLECGLVSCVGCPVPNEALNTLYFGLEECELFSCDDYLIPQETLSTLYLGLEPIIHGHYLSGYHGKDGSTETEWCSDVDRSDDAWTTPERSDEYE